MQATHKPRHRSLDVDGIEVFYREAGAADKPCVLLLHGFPSASHTFRHDSRRWPRSPESSGRHDPFFDLSEIMGYARTLDRLEMHVYDGGHLMLETHAPECAAAIASFITDVTAERATADGVTGRPG
ncbi:alpha/beta fold hydrolase [Nonomuraea sp. NPDC059194]|uniref:alpha/beta fold hydrolase n=1 Tax=Nonomuraea sp. NPDC059194 TaxID=3346764 RepID=UPI00369B036B